MRKLLPLLLVFIFLLGSSFPHLSYVDERTNTEIIFHAGGQIFPKHWYSPKIDATVEALSPGERSRIIAILNRAFSKYPDKVLRGHLDRVYAFRFMKFYGVAFGGTNFNNTVYISDDESSPSYTDHYIEGVFHHEFSSILKRDFPEYLNMNAWELINEPFFVYGSGGVYAIRTGDASLALDPSLFGSGFLTRYSQASAEEDFNVFSQHLFNSDPEFWGIIDNYPRLRRKAHLIIGFYQRIDPRFNETYFRRHIPYLAKR
jgi:hypothetical protein